jgi:hypothetical protein
VPLSPASPALHGPDVALSPAYPANVLDVLADSNNVIAAFEAKQKMEVKCAYFGERRVFPEPLKLASFPVACSVNGVYQFLSALCCVHCCLDIKSRAEAVQKKTASTLTPLFGCLISMHPLADPDLPRDCLGDPPPLDRWKKRWFAEYEHSLFIVGNVLHEGAYDELSQGLIVARCRDHTSATS